MKTYIIINYRTFKTALILLCLFGAMNVGYTQADTASKNVQQETEQPKSSAKKPVKNTFESIWILDNQTVMVPIKKTFELDFMHRFGTWNNGYEDFFGLFGGTNIRLGFNYVPIDKLLLGVSFTEYNLTWEGYAKYSLLKQTQDGSMPVSVTYYGNIAIDTKKDPNSTLYPHFTDRLMFFNQLLIARKISDKFSVQVAPSITHVNSVQGFYPGDTTADGKSVLEKEMHHDHFAIAFSGRIKLSNTLNLLLNYDQPLTKHKANNPNPNLSAGLEINTSSHTFQVIIGNYHYITPSRNNYYNHNDPTGYHGISSFAIGFNLTRLWNF
jgi:hypothetical protein